MSTKVSPRLDSDVVQTLYREYVPAITNLYTVKIMSYNESDYSTGANNYIKFHSPSVTIGEQSLSLERDSVTKLFKVQQKNSFTRLDQISITWRESDDWRVKKYHEAWLAKFYDVEKDCFISYDNPGLEGLARKIIIVLPKTLSQDDFKMTSSDTSNQNALEFYVYPHNTGSMNLGWTSNPAIATHSLSYYVISWKWTTEAEED